MKLIKVGVAVLNQTPLDWDGNKAHILEAIAQARAQEVKVLCLPELCITAYGCEDAFHMPGLLDMAWTMLQEILPETHGMIVSLGLPVEHANGLFNTVALVCDGRVLGFVAKRFLAGDGIHYEPRWFKPWPSGVQSEVEIQGDRFPIGDIYFDCGGVKIGFEICEDAWVATRPGGPLALKGVDLILNASASHFAFGKIEVRKRFVVEGSRAFGVTYLYANHLGNEAGRAIYDGGGLIASAGHLVASGPRFSFADVQITTATVDVSLTRMNQMRTSSFRPDVADRGEDCVRAPFSFPEISLEQRHVTHPAWETGAFAKEEEFARAVTLALFDYMRKSWSHGFVVSLSGGADSAAVVCLIALMVDFGVAELGRDGFLAKLSYMLGLKEADSNAAFVRRLLTTAYQATANSGDVTRNAAKAVAEAVGAEHLELTIDGLVKGYVDLASNALGRELTWEKDDIALQNIQARVRSPSVWMLANVKRALLLATSNRSEAAVGYATMDGDTSGGLSPIAGIDKNFLRRWLRWLEERGPESLHAIPALRHINAQQPTAELRPQQYHQTDEDDLMPYDLLDAIERAAIRDKMYPIDVFRLMHTRFPQYGLQQLRVWVERFFRLWCRNQWKRERYAPSFHLDDENLDPKTWCRFPILSGGFERELKQLKAYVDGLEVSG